MAFFQKAVGVLIDEFEKEEYEEEPLGGPTRYGITLPYLQDYFDRNGVIEEATAGYLRNMQRSEAEEIYWVTEWTYYGIGQVANQEAATVVLLASVNLGSHRAVKVAQGVLNGLYGHVKVDGFLGILTAAEINMYTHSGYFAEAMRRAVSRVYRDIVRSEPFKQKQLDGWLRRAAWRP